MDEKKMILDACCGSRMFWFDKTHPNVLFQDIRDAEYILCDGRKLEVHPDVVADFTAMPYPRPLVQARGLRPSTFGQFQ